MLATINTDASFNHQHKIGAYAFWIVCDQGKLLRSGVLREAKNAQDAELKCIANALHALLKSEFQGIVKIIINSDAKAAFPFISMRSPNDHPGKRCAVILGQLKERYLQPHEYGKDMHEIRHVKAHRGTNTRRKYVNDWCDKESRKMMRAEVKKLQSNNSK